MFLLPVAVHGFSSVENINVLFMDAITYLNLNKSIGTSLLHSQGSTVMFINGISLVKSFHRFCDAVSLS